MTDADQHDNLTIWLALDDHPHILNGVLLVAATSLALALSSCLWRTTRRHSQHSATMQEHPSSILTAALSSFHLLQSRPSDRSMPSDSPLSDTLAPPDGEQKDRKSTRSKERRRRGKDPLKDLFKGGKKSKALLMSIKTNENVNDTGTPPPSSDLDGKSSTLGIDSSSSTSRSVSPDISTKPSDHQSSRRLNPSSDDGSARNSSGHTPIPSSGEASDHDSSCHSHIDNVPPETEASISSSSTTDIPIPDTSLSSPTTPAEFINSRPRNSQTESPSGSSSSKPIRIRAKLRTSRIDSSLRLPGSLSVSDKPPSEVSSPAPSFPSTVSCPVISTPSSTNHSADGLCPSTPTNSRGPTPSPYRSPQRSPSPSQVPGEVQVGSQATSQYHTPVSAQTQLASLRGALEAARLREEKLRAEAEQANKERDELCWRWNEDAGAWRRREAELQAQIHHLMQQLHAYAVASFQAQQAQTRPSSGFSSPTSPHPHSSPRLQHHPLLPFSLPPAPAIQAQNSASAPAHVQALLASAPMLTSHHPGFGFGVGVSPAGMSSGPANGNSNGGIYSAGVGMSPLLWSGLGMSGLNRDARNGGHRTPDSCASGSSSRGRGRRQRAEEVKSASDDSSLGDWDGVLPDDGLGASSVAGPDPDSGWYTHGGVEGEDYPEDDEDEDEDEEWEEDMARKSMLADAILKRPESIRGLSRVAKRRSMNGIGNGAGVGVGVGNGVGRVPSRTSVRSVRSEGASPAAPAVVPIMNGTGAGMGVGMVDSAVSDVGAGKESNGVGFVPMTPLVNTNGTVQTVDSAHDRQ